MSVGQIFIIVITLLTAISLIIWRAFYFYKSYVSWRNQQHSSRQLQQFFTQPCSHSTPTLVPSAASMTCTLGSVLDRQLLEPGDHHDHFVRLHSVQTDFALNLPHSIALPDGEKRANCDIKLFNLRDPEQQAEITSSFIRAPPNRTVFDIKELQPLLFNSAPSSSPLSHANTTVIVPRSHSVSHVRTGKMDFARKRNNPSNSGSSHIWLPSSGSRASKKNTTHVSAETVTDNKNDCTLPPPSYCEVMKNKTHINPIPVIRHQTKVLRTSAVGINSQACANSRTSNRTHGGHQTLTNRDCENSDPPPRYNDVMNKNNTDSINRQYK